jgi:hypothetical protein
MELNELTQVMKMLDKIITSNRPEIKEAFRELLIISTLAEQGGDLAGPLESLMHEVKRLRQEVEILRYDLQRANNTGPYRTTTGTTPYTSSGSGPLTIFNPTTTSATTSTSTSTADSIRWLQQCGMTVTNPNFLDLGDL